MAYIIEIWGIQEDDSKFNEHFESKSTKPKNWLEKAKKKFPKINFNLLKDFGWRSHNK